MRQLLTAIVGSPLITGDLPAYDLPCSAVALVRPNYISRDVTHAHLPGACHQWPNALRISSTTAGLNAVVQN